MDFTSDFENCFSNSHDYDGPDIALNKKLQETRHALQETQSEVDQLKELIVLAYSESRVENFAVSEVTSQMKHQLFRNVSLPRNADNLPLNEMMGYVIYYMKFLGFATRKAAEEFHNVKDHLNMIHSSIKKNTVEEVVVPRTSTIKVPELNGKEMKRINTAKSPPTPPVTPPEHERKDEK